MVVKEKSLADTTVAKPQLNDDSRWQLTERVAHSSALSRAAQLRAILLYIVRQALLQPDEPIHEFEIAHRALGRRSDFNPLDDNIVRVQIAHLRKKLDHYFSTEGKNESVVITISMGSYMPIFNPRSASGNDPAEAQGSTQATIEAVTASSHFIENSGSHDEHQPSSPRPFAQQSYRLRWFIAIPVALVILTLSGLCIALWMQNQSLQRATFPWHYEPAMNAFWSDFLGSQRNSDLIMSDSFFKLAKDISKQPFTLDDYVRRSYVTDLEAQERDPALRAVLDKVSTWRSSSSNHLVLARRILALDPEGNTIRIYFSRDYTPDLIRQDNVILLGSRLTNPWADLVDARMNFEAKIDSNDITSIINRSPAPGEQAIYGRSPSAGYCVVAYLPNPTAANRKVLLIEGTSVEATEAGGDFLLSESQLASFRKMLHVDKFPYFEVLLKTSQVTGTPLTENIAAYRTYPTLH